MEGRRHTGHCCRQKNELPRSRAARYQCGDSSPFQGEARWGYTAIVFGADNHPLPLLEKEGSADGIPISHGIPLSTFALALVRNGTPILGIAYDPILDRMFVAERDKGTTMNGALIRADRTRNFFQKSLICSMVWTNTRNVGEMLSAFLPNGTIVMGPLSCVYSATLVAAGASSAVVFSGSMPWDAAASVILVEEAGGRVTDLFGASQRYDQITRGFIASNGTRIHDDLLAIIEKNFKPEDFLPH